MNLQDLQYKVRNLALDMQSLARLVGQEDFLKSWDWAPSPEKEKAVKLMLAGKRDDVKRWVKDMLASASDEEKSVRELRLEARKQGIPLYHHLNKAQLLERLNGPKAVG